MKKWRKEHRFSREQVCALIDCSTETLRKMEANDSTVSHDYWDKAEELMSQALPKVKFAVS